MHTSALVRKVLRATYLPILLLSLCFISVNAQTTAAIFPVAQQFALSSSSFLDFAGDFNGDGVADLAYTDGTSLKIVLSPTSNSPTTVTTQLVCTQGTLQGTLNFADLNNDKKLDLVFPCGGYLTILLGNGDGTFQAPAYFATSAQSPILVDLNGDGFLDIAGLVTSGTAPQVVVLLNKGTASPGVFQAPTQYAAPVGSNSLLAGDFNGDGKQDVVIKVDDPNYEPGVYEAFSAFSILYGNGDGTLQAGISQSFAFTALTVGDFNRDGVTDIAMLLLPAATSTGLFTSVQVLLGSTSGTFGQGASLPIAAESSANAEVMTAVALSSNGNLDLVVAGKVLDVFAGDGTGGFSASRTYAVSGAGQLLFADLSGSGNQGLIAVTPSGVGQYFPGNGDGTLQAAPGVAAAGPAVDVNNDGIADLVFNPPQASYFGVALGRGDGSFSILNQTVPLSNPNDVHSLMTGDFNGDGKNDVLDIAYSYGRGDCLQANATLSTFLGSGDGRFQALSTPLALGPSFVSAGITGDFNSDGKLDLILPLNGSTCAGAIAFVSGNGDGSFAAPVPLNANQDLQGPGLLVGDLNRDNKPDFVWGDAVFLGNGDGTFKQIPLTIPTASLGSYGLAALVDLNGDGILDAVLATGTAVYAGNGDGTFQTTPFYSVSAGFLAAADVNGDGKQDLLLQERGVENSESLAVYLGDGSGSFTQDTHTYYLDGANAAPARINNQAPPLANDQNLDLLTSIETTAGPYTASLVNQTNPAPVKPGLIASTTTLVASSLTGTPGSTITLTASVLGTNPSPSVTFAANGSNLGTEALANGTATLQTSFANPGSYTVTASYPGDSNNTASTSNAVTVVIAAPGFTIAASPASSTVKAGQTANFTFAVTPSGGYSGTVTFSCGALPSKAACVFSPASITPSGSAAASSTLTVTTTAASTALLDPNPPFDPRGPSLPMGGLALAGAISLGLSAGRTKRWNNRSRLLNSAFLLALLSLAVGGCGGGGGNNTPPPIPGTPAGTYTITVTAADNTGGLQQTATVSLTVQ